MTIKYDEMREISLSISIVSFDSSKDELVCCVDSIERATGVLSASNLRCKVSVSVVNNGPDLGFSVSDFDRKDVEGYARPSYFSFQVIQGHGNVGYGSGQNLGFSSSKADYHLYLNPDIELESDCLLEGIRFLEANPDVGLVSPHAVNEAGVQQFLCKRYPALFDFILRGFAPAFVRKYFRDRMQHYEMRDLSETAPTKEIPIISGCFMLCRSETIRLIEGFDERFFLYFEDFDLSLRAGEIVSLAYLPSMRIKHYGGKSAQKGLRHILMFMASAYRFFSKHGWRWY